MKILKIAATLVIISSLVIAHELGHLNAMRTHNIEIKEFGLGFGFGLKPLFSFTISPVPDVIFVVNLFPLGGYVEPTEKGVEQIRKLPLKNQLSIYGMGIWVNTIIGLLLYCIFLFPLVKKITWKEIVLISLLLFSLAFPEIFTMFLIPITGMLLLALGIIHYKKIELSILEVYTDVYGIKKTKELVLNMTYLSLSLALFNTLPLKLFDGGQTMKAIISTFCPQVLVIYEEISLIFFSLLVGIALMSDFEKILNQKR